MVHSIIIRFTFV